MATSSNPPPNTPPCAGQCADWQDIDITMAFQPVVDRLTHKIHAYEALVRGTNGESAGEVLSRVDETTLYAFDQACRHKAIQLAARLGLDRRLNINFLPNAVYHPHACLRITIEASQTYGFPLEQITFEFTENELIEDPEHLQTIISAYRDHHFKTALDDFGAGYANLSLLADFATDIIKLDRVLIDKIDTNRARQAIVSGLMGTAHMLEMDVVAEGVERVEEYQVLADMGVRYYQGYLFAKPELEYLADDEDIAWP